LAGVTFEREIANVVDHTDHSIVPSRIPIQGHSALRDLRDYHLRVTGEVLRRIDRRESNVVSFECP
jgi:hypothetical protein